MKFFYTLILVLSLFTIPQTAQGFSQSDIYWLSQNIYHEARGEDNIGQVMVGIVTLSRKDSGLWGNTIKDVVTAPKQFSWYSPRHIIPTNKKAWLHSKEVAFYSILCYYILGKPKVIYYHTKNICPSWSRRCDKVSVVGNHIFYKSKKRKG